MVGDLVVVSRLVQRVQSIYRGGAMSVVMGLDAIG